MNLDHDHRAAGKYPAPVRRILALQQVAIIDAYRRSPSGQDAGRPVDRIGEQDVAVDVESVAAVVPEYGDFRGAVMAMANDIEIANWTVLQGGYCFDIAGKSRFGKTGAQFIDLPVTVRESQALAVQQNQGPVAVVETGKRTVARDSRNAQPVHKRTGPGIAPRIRFRQQHQRFAKAVTPWHFLVTLWLMNLKIVHYGNYRM